MIRSIHIALLSYLAPMATARGVRIALMVCVAVPAILLVALALDIVTREHLMSIPAFVLIPGLPLLATLLGEMALRDGITQRTLLYPLLGPVPRATIAVVRTLTTGLILFILTAGMTLAIRLICQAPWAAFPRELLALFLGGLAYGALASLVHLLTRRGLIAGLALFLGLDSAIGRLPFSMARIAPSYHVWVVADRLQTMIYEIPIGIDAPDGSVTASIFTLLLFTALATTLTAAIFTRRNLATLC